MYQYQSQRDFNFMDGKQQRMNFAMKGVPMGMGAMQAHGSIPRSAAEATLDTSSKFRQLPCKTFISVGTCPYGERCVFLHDPRCISNASHSITRLKNKEDTIADSLFWPLVCCDQSLLKKNECNFYPYTVPIPRNDDYRMHDEALYSMWMHFVDYCKAASKIQKIPGAHAVVTTVVDIPINTHTNNRRLPVFQLLSSSNGRDITGEQFLGAYYIDATEAVNCNPTLISIVKRNQRKAMLEQQQLQQQQLQFGITVTAADLANVANTFPDVTSSESSYGDKPIVAGPYFNQMGEFDIANDFDFNNKVARGLKGHVNNNNNVTGNIFNSLTAVVESGIGPMKQLSLTSNATTTEDKVSTIVDDSSVLTDSTYSGDNNSKSQSLDEYDNEQSQQQQAQYRPPATQIQPSSAHTMGPSMNASTNSLNKLKQSIGLMPSSTTTRVTTSITATAVNPLQLLDENYYKSSKVITSSSFLPEETLFLAGSSNNSSNMMKNFASANVSNNNNNGKIQDPLSRRLPAF